MNLKVEFIQQMIEGWRDAARQSRKAGKEANALMCEGEAAEYEAMLKEVEDEKA